MTGLTLQSVEDQLRVLGLTIKASPGDYCVNFRGFDERTAYHTDDISDALATGRRMAENPPEPKLPPLGPMSGRKSRKAQMIRHNRLIADRRRRKGQL